MGQRICIIGNSGSGKSSLANELGKVLGIPVIHLDKVMLHGDFQDRSHEERLKIHSKIVSGDNWVIDGNYRYYLPERLEGATLVIFLNVPRYLTLINAFKRKFSDKHPKDSVPEGANIKKLTPWLLKQILKYSRHKKLAILKDDLRPYPNAKLLVLRPGSMVGWVKQVQDALS